VEISNPELILVACTHRYSYHNSPSTVPIRQSLATKGSLCADVALRKYFINSYPYMSTNVMNRVSKWFLSDLALARYGTSLQLKDVIQFDTATITCDKISKPERVTLLASTLKCLLGVVYEDKGINGVDKAWKNPRRRHVVKLSILHSHNLNLNLLQIGFPIASGYLYPVPQRPH